jgi:hypothetical protein
MSLLCQFLRYTDNPPNLNFIDWDVPFEHKNRFYSITSVIDSSMRVVVELRAMDVFIYALSVGVDLLKLNTALILLAIASNVLFAYNSITWVVSIPAQLIGCYVSALSTSIELVASLLYS